MFPITLARAVCGATVCLLLASDASAQQGRGALGQLGGTFTIQGPGPYIGVTVRDLESTDANASAGGVLVTAISPDSPAASAGLQVSDVIVEFDGERVRSVRQFARLVQETAQGRQVRASVVRGGKRQEVTMTPADSAKGLLGLGRGRADVPRANDLLRRFEDVKPQLRFQGAPRLGVTLQSMTPELASHFGAAEGGVLVSAVVVGSEAARAGLLVGDVITTAAGQRVRSQTDLTQALRSADSSIALGVVRDKKALTVTVSLPGAARAPAGRVI
jgi:serine protease Do